MSIKLCLAATSLILLVLTTGCVPKTKIPTPDTTAPTLAWVTLVPGSTSDTTPNYIFKSSEKGTITYGGDCSSATASAKKGDNTITFNALAEGVHSNCTITVTDAASNTSVVLKVGVFTIVATVPAGERPATDSDGDGLSDSDEINVHSTNPNSRDSDSDGLTDYAEVIVYHSNPNATDSDGDGIADATDNCKTVSNASQADWDRDGTGDACDPDMDGDGMPNAWETAYGLDPLNDRNPVGINYDKQDPDGDGLVNLYEYYRGTDPGQADSDGDGTIDGSDSCPIIANADQLDSNGNGFGDACDPDSDNDGLPDWWEKASFGNLKQTASGNPDGDGLTNLQEYQLGSNPKKADSDGDGKRDNIDNCPVKPNADQADLDSDGSGDVCDSDRDGDGFSNHREYVVGSDPDDLDGAVALHLDLSFFAQLPAGHEYIIGLAIAKGKLVLITTTEAWESTYTLPPTTFQRVFDPNFAGVRMHEGSTSTYLPGFDTYIFIGGLLDSRFYLYSRNSQSLVAEGAMLTLFDVPRGIVARDNRLVLDGPGVSSTDFFASNWAASAPVKALYRFDAMASDQNGITFANSGAGKVSENVAALTMGPDDRLYVLDTGRQEILRFDADTLEYLGAIPLVSATVNNRAFAITSTGFIFTLNQDTLSGDIYDITTDHHIGTFSQEDDQYAPGRRGKFSMATDTQGRVFITNGTGFKVFFYDTSTLR